jgi:hypothetical protein
MKEVVFLKSRRSDSSEMETFMLRQNQYEVDNYVLYHCVSELKKY